MALDRLRDRIGDRVHALAVVHRDPRAADAFELIDDLVDGDAGPQAERHESGDPFGEGCRVSAAAADLRENFEQALLVLVDGHIQRAVSGEDLLCAARDHVGPGPRSEDRGLRRNFDVNFRRLLRVRDTDVQDLVFPRAVAVDGDAFAMQVEREQVGLLHVLHSRLPPHVDRLRDRGIAPVLERGLHPHVPFR